jgi:hypothetical protein
MNRMIARKVSPGSLVVPSMRTGALPPEIMNMKIIPTVASTVLKKRYGLHLIYVIYLYVPEKVKNFDGLRALEATMKRLSVYPLFFFFGPIKSFSSLKTLRIFITSIYIYVCIYMHVILIT